MTSAFPDEHVIRCSICGRGLLVKDNVNNGMAFLSHLKNDHQVFYTPQQMEESKVDAKRRAAEINKQMLEPPK